MKFKGKFNYLSIIFSLLLLTTMSLNLEQKVSACTENEECLTEEYCQKEDGDCNGQGVCSVRPETCLQIWDPVCGCDGLIYPNFCVAQLNGINIAPWRECHRFRRQQKNTFRKRNLRQYKRRSSNN